MTILMLISLYKGHSNKQHFKTKGSLPEQQWQHRCETGSLRNCDLATFTKSFLRALQKNKMSFTEKQTPIVNA